MTHAALQFFITRNRMSESMRIARRRNMMAFAFYETKAGYKEEQQGPFTYDSYYNRIVGAVETGEILVEPPEPTPPEPTYDLSLELLNAFEAVLQYAATNNLGPTRSSRFYYLWFFSLSAAYQRTTPKVTISGTKYDWNWDIHNFLSDDRETCVWILSVLEAIMPRFNNSYSASAAFSVLKTTYGWDDLLLESQKQLVKEKANFDGWLVAYNIWWSSCAADGSDAATIPPVDDDLPNRSTRLDVSLTDDPATFRNPDAWTPLKIGAKSQKYLTYTWENVRSPCLTSADVTQIKAAANAYYPTAEARRTEINEVVSITNTLTDAEKVSGEFWAGGPFTVSPPGMLLWLWKIYVGIPKRRAVENVLYSGLDLALHLFETGRIVWALKKEHMQARPIQEIRRFYRFQTVKKYDGTDISGSAWVPYQETNFVTPPFADFPSGHSAFSRSFANVMTKWYGPTIDTSSSVEMSDIKLISPALEPQTQKFGTFVFATGASQIQAGVVPAAPVTLSWNTWLDVAESAGISRKYGGIHATSAHVGSVAAADALHSAINRNFVTLA